MLELELICLRNESAIPKGLRLPYHASSIPVVARVEYCTLYSLLYIRHCKK